MQHTDKILAGAINAGLQSGFIMREGQSLYSLSDIPTYEVKYIYEMALVVIEKYK
ncbi:hypothetical protein [Flavobacterium cellulosilyticum]|uniref:hypothetical protein n=1 Tax=Flavobacterium cellulosilyticum TaxID=2541731 RepID=UPI001404F837|nr:hypothetical protein [Flavobacterium cellulosilyticum]